MRTIIANDIRNGTVKNIYKYILTIIFTTAACAMLQRDVTLKYTYGRLDSDVLGIGDYIFYMFGGMKEYVETEGSIFEVPVVWLGWQLLICSSVFLYPVMGNEKNSAAALILSGSRTKWWLGKCIWSVTQVVNIFACIIAGCVLMSAMHGFNGAFMLHREALSAVTGVGVTGGFWRILFGIFCALIYSIMITLIQITAAMLVNPLAALAAVVAYDTLSAYFMSPVLLGNIAMLYRNTMTAGQGADMLPQTAAAAIIAAVVTAAGTHLFKRRDIYGI